MNYEAWLEQARTFHREGHTRPLSFRQRQLALLEQALNRRETDLLEALYKDLGKPSGEAYASEIGFVLAGLRHARRHLRSWAAPTRVSVPPLLWPARGQIVYEPYGVALILGAWNYPVQLVLSPLVAAMAAGNCAAVKPSELAPHAAAVLASLLAETFDENYICAFEGDAALAARLCEMPFEKLFFTGSTAIGRRVMEAAAKHLTPVTLELGGCNPCVVCRDAHPRIAARRIAWGKFLNAGQTCVAPNHVWVDEAIRDDFLGELTRAIRQFYGDDPSVSPDYGRIVNDRHFERLARLLQQGKPCIGGTTDAVRRYMAPTVLIEVDPASPLLAEEIFGPLLPVVSFRDLEGLMQVMSGGPKPLALYLFTHDPAVQQRVMACVPSGGVCVNDTVNHVVAENLPFGGVGDSGLGAYHGRAGFEAFSHRRSVLVRSERHDPGLYYPPQRIPLRWLKRVLALLQG